MPWKWYDSQIIQIKDLSPQVKQFWLKISDQDRFQFKAGQFVTLDLPIHDKRTKRWRSYSIANHPDDTNILELCVVFNPEGEATKYLFNEAKIGTAIKFKGPSGTFTLPEDLSDELVLISTGTGVVPFRSMLWDIYYDQKDFNKIHLIFGTRHETGILYRNEFEELAKRLKNFEYSIALSREENWSGCKGYVHKIYESMYQEVIPNRKFYLCGWSNMIDDAVAKLLIDMKYDKSQILYELYG